MERYEVILMPFSKEFRNPSSIEEFSCPDCGSVTKQIQKEELADGGVGYKCKDCGSSYVLGEPYGRFSCPNCKETVIATTRVQGGLAVGGVGHKCNNCDTYYALVLCPCCNSLVGFDDKEWDLLASSDGSKCPNCKAYLYRNKIDSFSTFLNVGGVDRYLPKLSSWSSSSIEKSYISEIKLNCNSEYQKKIAIRHHAVGVRMKSSKQSMEFLINEKWYLPLTVSNSPVPYLSLRTPFDHEFHDNLFGFINNLSSALDMLAQEIASVYLSEYDENKIYYERFLKNMSINSQPIAEQINLLKSKHTYNYFKKLRNLLQHNRLPMMVTRGEPENVHFFDSIRPETVKSLATVYLPQNPFEESDELPVTSGVELFKFLKEVYSDIETHILNVYEVIEPCQYSE